MCLNYYVFSNVGYCFWIPTLRQCNILILCCDWPATTTVPLMPSLWTYLRIFRMRKRSVLYSISALLFFFLCFFLVHNARIPPLPSGGLKELIPSRLKSNDTGPKIVELQLGEKIVRYKKNVENLDYVDTIRRPRKLPIVKADNKINAVVDANNVSEHLQF